MSSRLPARRPTARHSIAFAAGPRLSTRALAVAAILTSVVAALLLSLQGKSVSADAQPVMTIYPASTVPVQVMENDAQSTELGVQFSVAMPGKVLGLKYYRSTRNTGTHTGTLWTAAGSKLASATFTAETASGWQTVRFASPVTLAARTNYVASYHTSSGYYSQQQYAFDRGATLGNRTIAASHGVYRYGAGGFPTSTWHSAAYYVDVLFQPGGTVTASTSASTSVAPVTIPAKSSSSPAPVKSSTTAPKTTAPSSLAPTSSAAPTSAAPAPPTTSSAPPATIPPPSGASTGCLAKPSACGFPDATNTGVPAGTALKASGDLTISTPGATVSGLNVSGCVHITASNVTFKNSQVHGNCGGSPMISVPYNGVSGVVIDHVEIDGGKTSPSSPGITGAGYTASYVNIHGTGDGIDIQNNDTVHDSYIHDLWVASGDHTDGIQSAGGTNSSVVHTTIQAGCAGCNSAMIIGADLGPIGTFTANNNLFDGGGFTLYAGTGGYDSGSITFSNSRFGTGYSYGATSFKPSAGRTVAFTGNVWDATNKAFTG